MKEVITHLTDYFSNYSTHKVIVSDRGSCFTSHDFTEFLAENDIKHALIATGCPRANGQIERINRLLSPLLGKIEDEKQIDWVSAICNIPKTTI